MLSSSAIDISLLAILMALHLSNNKDVQNLKLSVLVILVAHALFTTHKMYERRGDENLEVENSQNEDVQNVSDVPEEILGAGKEDQDKNAIEVDRKDFTLPSQATSEGDGEYRRNFTAPSNSKHLFQKNVSNDLTKFNKDLANSALEL